ncbi:MAG: hypothetical protein A2X64_10555 [Ignavibacteria bacterium GWF2_33_9]|nr:MAG: hypothetical protein A2X64_10555 [Ignavibacteria bacterium GWF2_33_9]
MNFFSIPNHLKFIFLLISFFILFPNVNVYSQQLKPNLSKPLNPETFKEWDTYIRKYAPSQDAYSVVVHIARIHYQSRNYIVALEVFYLYENLFPNYSIKIEQEKTNLIRLALVQSPEEERRKLYNNLAIRIKNTEDGFIAVQRYTEKFIREQQFDSALAAFENFKPLYPALERKFDGVIEVLSRKEDNVTIIHLPKNINSSQDEWDPNPTPDGKYLFFSGQRQGSMGGNDVFISTNQGETWSNPVSLGLPINSEANETIDNVSVDGNTLFLSGNFAGTFGLFDIYSASATEEGWGNLYHYPMPINSTYQDESGYLTSDGKALLFTSDRPNESGEQVSYGTYFHGGVNGNMDIYVSLKTEDGWSEPINLGPAVNTPFSERSAFLHPDGKTLYFSSDGHPGLGHMDVFKSVRLSDSSWKEWSEPVNLGRYINSADDDWGYKIGLTGDTAYFSSRYREDSNGGLDLYAVTLPGMYKPAAVASIRGHILSNDGKPLAADIKWQNLATGENLGILKSNPKTGNYFIVLPLGKNYGFYAEKKGFYPTSGNIDLTKFKKDTSITLNITLTSLEEMKENKTAITINNLFFDFDKFDLKPESFFELDRLVNFLKDAGEITVQISGHTDNRGTDSYNKDLAYKRANAVKDYLTKKGVNKKMIVKSFGASQPVTQNDTEENRSKNRRVEINLNK